ncbi:MAG: hypothetical protein JKY70_01575 [Mucilaginibacter sp.]|nr:hypothetical protein [Mucilaginibacter sp.]
MNPLFLYSLFANYLVPLSALAPIFFALKNYRSLPPAFEILCAFIIVSSLFNLVNLIAIYQYHVRTIRWIHIYTILEFTFVTLVFSRVFNKKWRIPLYALIAVFGLICTIDLVFIQNKLEFNTYTRPVGALIIIGLCMGYIINTSTVESKWTDNSFNWVNTGLLLYYSGGLIMFTFSNYFLKPTLLTLLIWTIHNSILIVEYILFAIGFRKYGLEEKAISSTPIRNK